MIKLLEYKLETQANELKDLDELRALGSQHDSITEGLYQMTQNKIQDVIVQKVMEQLPDFSVIDAQI